MRAAIVVLGLVLAGCAEYYVRHPNYTPVTAGGNECRNQCVMVAQVCRDPDPLACAQLFEGCARACMSFHGGGLLPLCFAAWRSPFESFDPERQCKGQEAAPERRPRVVCEHSTDVPRGQPGKK